MSSTSAGSVFNATIDNQLPHFESPVPRATAGGWTFQKGWGMVSGIPMTKARNLLVVAMLLAAALPAFAQNDAVVGRIKSAAGAVSIVRQGSATPAQVGQPLFQSDSVRTGADGRVGITLKDETRLALGPNTDVRIDQFAYSPGQSNLRMVMKIARGLVAYVSGRIAKLSPDAVRLETPSAILGVRGTRMVIRVGVP